MISFLKKLRGVVFFSLLFGMFITVAYAGEYEEYLRSQQESFQSYKDARDAEFIGFLKDQWKEFQIHQGLERDSKPKPVDMPVAKGKPKPEPVSEDTTKLKPIKVPEKKITVPDGGVADAVIKQTPTQTAHVKIDFYDKELSFYSDFKFSDISIQSINKDVITRFWDVMSKADYEQFMMQARKYQKALRLNDWGYHNLLNQYALNRFEGDQNIANLFVWYISSKSGYDARIGYNNDSIYLLLPSRNRLYGLPFLTIKQKKYYALYFDRTPVKFKSLFTYKGDYPKANQLMDYRLTEPPRLVNNPKTRRLQFEHLGKKHTVNTTYNESLITYFKYYPQTNIKVYFDAAVIPETEYSLVKSLKPILEGKSEAEAVNIILKFVQTALRYKTDAEQFGREKYLLPNETIFYPYCDCEDRSFLFSFLVKKLTGLEVVGLDYPGHIATAVRFSDNVNGDYIVLNNKKYMVCDPTYINATVGMTMPRYKKVEPKVIIIQ